MTSAQAGWDARTVGGLVGLILVFSGASKSLHIESSSWERTVVWQYLGGSRALLLILAVGEVAVGLCLLTWLRPRLLFALLVPAFLFAAWVMIHEVRSGRNRACGCIADAGREDVPSFVRPLVLTAAGVYVLVVTRIRSRLPEARRSARH